VTSTRKGRGDRAAPAEGWHAVLTPLWAACPARQAQAGTGRRVRERLAWLLPPWRGDSPVPRPVAYADADTLAWLIGEWQSESGRLTLWLPRGWEDLVGSGLAELMDEGRLKWRWCCLDGARVLLRGSLDGRPVGVTSLAAWTGGAWDAWAEDVRQLAPSASWPEGLPGVLGLTAGEVYDCADAVASVRAVLAAHAALTLGEPGLSVGSAARTWWAAWGSPRVQAFAARPVAKGGRPAPRAISQPVPGLVRPRKVRVIEGHLCHGLAREQYFRGQVGGPVHVLDLKSAYLAALGQTPLPSVYHQSLDSPTHLQLGAALKSHTGCALVCLDTSDHPYMVYRHDSPVRAVGTYWAWLAGDELYSALVRRRVRECRGAHLWWAVQAAAATKRLYLEVSREVLDTLGGALRPCWRALYASLVGGWAQRSWRWEREDRESQVGRWATWTMGGSEGQELERWRVVAGRVQRRVYRGLARHAHPLSYACVTAAIRHQIDRLREGLPAGSVLATACDALWVTDDAPPALEAAAPAGAPAGWISVIKQTYDDAWLDGEGSAVVKKDGLFYPLLPGVPHGVAIQDDGHVRWDRAAPWTDGPGPAAGTLPPRRRASWDGGTLMDRWSVPLEPVQPWHLLCEPDLNPALLAPYDPRRVRRREKEG
jgi:hypothetical protein